MLKDRRQSLLVFLNNGLLVLGLVARHSDFALQVVDHTTQHVDGCLVLGILSELCLIIYLRNVLMDCQRLRQLEVSVDEVGKVGELHSLRLEFLFVLLEPFFEIRVVLHLVIDASILQLVRDVGAFTTDGPICKCRLLGSINFPKLPESILDTVFIERRLLLVVCKVAREDASLQVLSEVRIDLVLRKVLSLIVLVLLTSKLNVQSFGIL